MKETIGVVTGVLLGGMTRVRFVEVGEADD